MALKTVPFRTLAAVIKAFLDSAEDPDTAETIRALKPAAKRGFFLPMELEMVCMWKSPRAIRHIRRNDLGAVQDVTRAALRTKDEGQRLQELTKLWGVSVPMASAILMLTDPKRYGVIDIRVWQLLHTMGAVNRTPSGIGFDSKNWNQFLSIIRSYAKQFEVTARDIERALFLAHKEYQKGLLYISS